MIDVTVVVATFGGDEWVELAQSRAVPSAMAAGVPVVYTHEATLHEARNAGLAQVSTEWVCHLDADDELERGYFDAVGAVAAEADIVAPAVRYLGGLISPPPYIPRVAGHGHPDHECGGSCLDDGNFVVVGAPARVELVRAVGGWRDFPIYEDWDLWLRCWRYGCRVARAPGAVYRAHVRPGSRNRSMGGAERDMWHRRISAGVTV